MRVDDKSHGVVINLREYQRLRAMPKNAGTDAPSRDGAREDEVELSSMMKQSREIGASLREFPDVREERVKELKALLASGDYRVSGRDIAEKMLKKAGQDPDTPEHA